jgi:hypothetical protein
VNQRAPGHRTLGEAKMEKFALHYDPVGAFFQLDGAPPHFCCVHAFLDREFPDCWVGRGEPIPWPPRSHDLNPLDFSSGGL